MNLGVRWARAIKLDPEVRHDWEQWLKARRDDYIGAIIGCEQDSLIHRLQGKLQALDELELFIDLAVERHLLEESKMLGDPPLDGDTVLA